MQTRGLALAPVVVALLFAAACASSDGRSSTDAGVIPPGTGGSAGSSLGGSGGVGAAGGSGGSGANGGSSASGGSGGSSSGGVGGAGGGSGGVGGGGSPDLSNVTFDLWVTGQSKDPGGEGGPAMPWTVNVCIDATQGGFVQVQNTGTGVANGFSVGIALMKDYPTPNSVVGSCTSLVESDTLAPGVTTQWTSATCCTFDDTASTFDLNPRKLRVTADVNAEVTESNEANNTAFSAEFELKQLPAG
jgi:hypothetical protein